MWTNRRLEESATDVMKEICDLQAVKNAWLVRV